MPWVIHGSIILTSSAPSLGGGSKVLVPSSFKRTSASAVVSPSGTPKVPAPGARAPAFRSPVCSDAMVSLLDKG